MALGVLVVDAASGMLVACADITGLSSYSEGDVSVDGSVAVGRDAADRGDGRAGEADAHAEGELGADGAGNAEGECGDATSVLNCHACDVACDTTHSLVPECTGATCTYAGCSSSWANCDTSPPDTDGCETSLTTPSNCSGCGRACDTVHSTGAACNGSTCVYAGCADGWADCNQFPPDTDGCETPVSGPSCGACGKACDTTHSLGPNCHATTCAYTGCAAGWADCNTTPPDTNGCETSLSSLTNCSACGRACNTATGTPSCNGATCSYACNSGRADCNASTAPDTDGCECATPGCCSGVCQGVHSNGEGQSFYDCAAPNTYNQTQAMEACIAFTENSSQCTQSSTFCASITYAVCSVAASTCRCWQYSGSNPGTVQSPGLGCSAQCGSGSDPKWN